MESRPCRNQYSRDEAGTMSHSTESAEGKQMPKLFMVGGAKGVGKTSLTTLVSQDLGIARVETGKLLSEYLAGRFSISFRDYITQRMLEIESEFILDTHFAQYPPNAQETTPFERGIDSENLLTLAGKFDIWLCLLDLNPQELQRRRLNGQKRRSAIFSLILEELEYSQRAATMYSAELGKPVFRLSNDYFEDSKLKLEGWIQILRGVR